MTENLRVAMIGYGFMGAAHSQGWRVAPRFFDLPAEPTMSVVVGRNPAAVSAAAEKWGWAEAATDWREVIARDDEVDLLTEQSFRELLTYMLEDTRNISRAIRLTFIGKYFERIGDGATNICEMVVYLVEGKVIKHSGANESD